MIMQLFAVYDKRAGEYSPPQCYPTYGVAERAFSDAINAPDSHLNKHPEDYNLQLLGTYETEKGVIMPNHQGPTIIVDAIQLLKPLK